MRVLIVDDHQAFRAPLRSNLEAFGFDVVEARDVLAGLQSAIEAAPDVVIVGESLSGLSGRDFAEAVAKEPATRALPIVLACDASGATASPGDRHCAANTIHATLSRAASPVEWQRVLCTTLARRAPAPSVRGRRDVLPPVVLERMG